MSEQIRALRRTRSGRLDPLSQVVAALAVSCLVRSARSQDCDRLIYNVVSNRSLIKGQCVSMLAVALEFQTSLVLKTVKRNVNQKSLQLNLFKILSTYEIYFQLVRFV